MESSDVPEITAQVEPGAAQTVDISEIEDYKPDLLELEKELEQFKHSKDEFDEKVSVETWQNPDEKVLAIDV